MKQLDLSFPSMAFLKVVFAFDYFNEERIPLVFSFDRNSQSVLLAHQIQVKRLKNENAIILALDPQMLEGSGSSKIEVQLTFKDQRYLKFQNWNHCQVLTLEGKNHDVAFISEKQVLSIPLTLQNFNNLFLKVWVPSVPMRLKYHIESQHMNVRQLNLEEGHDYPFTKACHSNHVVFESAEIYRSKRVLDNKIQLLDIQNDQEKILIQSMPLPSVDEIYIEEKQLVGLVKLKI